MDNKVEFPPFYYMQRSSEILLDFFVDSGVKESDAFFDLKILRKLYINDRGQFDLIVLDLSLRGFNFYSDKSNVFFPPPLDYSKIVLISTGKNANFKTIELYKLNLMKIFAISGISTTTEIALYPIKRLEYYSTIDSNNILLGLSLNEYFYNKSIGSEKVALPLNEENMSSVENYNIIKNNLQVVQEIIVFYLSILSEIPDSYLTLFEPDDSFCYFLLNIVTFDESEILKKISMPELDECSKFHKKLHSFLKTYNEVTLHKFSEIEFSNLLKSIFVYMNSTISNVSLQQTNVNRYARNLFCSFLNGSIKKGEEQNFFTTSVKDNIEKFSGFTIYDRKVLVLTLANILLEESFFYKLYEDDIDIIFGINRDDFLYYKKYLNLILTLEDRRELISMRDYNQSLEAIGLKFKITRERVRQIVAEYVRKNKKVYKELLNKLSKNSNLILYNDAKKYTGLVSYLKNDFCYEFKYIKKYNWFVKRELHLSELIDLLDSNKIIKYRDLPYLHPETKKILFTTLKYDHDYTFFSNRIYNLKLMTKRDLGEAVILKLGHEGFREFNYEKVVKIFETVFRLKDVSRRNICVYISENPNAVLRGTSEWIHSSYISMELLCAIENLMNTIIINKSGVQSKDIYVENSNYLNGLGVDNYEFLYGILTYYPMFRLNGSGRGMRLFREEHSGMDTLGEVIESEFKIHLGIMSKVDIELQSKFSIEQADNSGVVIKYDSNTYALIDFLKAKKMEKEIMRKVIDEEFLHNNNVCTMSILMGKLQIDSRMVKFLEKCKVLLGTEPEKRLARVCEINFKKDLNVNYNVKVIMTKDLKLKSVKDCFFQYIGSKVFRESDVKNYLNENNFADGNKYGIVEDTYCVGVDEYQVNSIYLCSDLVLNTINSLLNEKFYNTPIIHISDLINLLKIRNLSLSSRLLENKISLTSLLSKWKECDFSRPNNDLGIGRKQILFLLQNNKRYGIEFSLGLKETIKKSYDKPYITVNEVNKLLKIKGFIEKDLTDRALKKLFKDSFYGGDIIDVQKL